MAAQGEHPGPGRDDSQGRIPPGLLCCKNLVVGCQHAPELAPRQEASGGRLQTAMICPSGLLWQLGLLWQGSMKLMLENGLQTQEIGSKIEMV